MSEPRLGLPVSEDQQEQQDTCAFIGKMAGFVCAGSVLVAVVATSLGILLLSLRFLLWCAAGK